MWYLNRSCRRYFQLHKLAQIHLASERVNDALARGVCNIVYKELRKVRLGKFSANVHSIVRLIGCDFLPCALLFEEQSAKRLHFFSQLGGSDTFVFQSACCNRRCEDEIFDMLDCYRSPDAATVCLQAAPGYHELMEAFLRASLGAPGEAPIKGSIFSKCSKVFAQLSSPVIFKHCGTLKPSLQWRRGIPHALFKNKVSTADMPSYRDIYSGDVVGRTYTKHQLPSQLDTWLHWYAMASRLRCGGREDWFRALVCLSVANRVSCSMLFLDIVNAFITRLRRMLICDYDCDEAWLEKLLDDRFSRDGIDFILEIVNNRSWVTLSVLGRFYKPMWCSHDGIRGVLIAHPPECQPLI